MPRPAFFLALFAWPVFVFAQMDSSTWRRVVPVLARTIHRSSPVRSLMGPSTLAYQDEAVRLKALNVVASRPREDVLRAYSSRRSQRRAEKFIREYRAAFSESYYRWRVPPSIVASILYVETLYGHLKLKDYPTLDTLVSLAALSDRSHRKSLIDGFIRDAVAADPKTRWRSRTLWDQRLREIGAFWKNELSEYGRLAGEMGWSEATIRGMRGSWAGAFGKSQMLPSTARKKRAVFGAFDPWKWEDAIALTAFELYEKGWGEDPRRAIFEYNRADWYVQAVMGLSESIQGKAAVKSIESAHRPALTPDGVDPQEQGQENP